MKLIKAGLLDDVVSSYDQTKTTIQGNIIQKVVSGQNVLGPSLNKWMDVVTDTTPSSSVVPSLSWLSPNGRLFSIGVEAGGVTPISLYTIDFSTGVTTYRGTIRVTTADTAATTTTFRFIKAIDTGVTGWKIFIGTTGSVLINGGVYCVNKVDLADFLNASPGTLFPAATSSDVKATYFLQDPSNIGVGQLNVATAGAVLDSANNRLYVHNGVAATHQYYVYDTSIAPTYTPAAVSVSVASPGKVTYNSHPFLTNDPVVFTSGTLPTGLVLGTVYFVRNPTANDFELSATSGGASINTTGSPSVGANIGRAFGTTGSNWIHKTGNLPALTGTLILLDSEDYAVPGHTTNSGFACAFLATTTNLYLGKLSELTSGATTWPSLVTSNILGTVNQITTPTVAQATWSNILDRAVYITNSNLLVMKQVINNSIDKVFGGSSNLYRETFPLSDTQGIGGLTFSALDIEAGWLVLTGTAVGQRGNILADLRSDASFGYSYIVTKVLDTPSATYKLLAAWQQLEADSGTLKIQYRTSGFGSISGGWTDLSYLGDITAIASASQIQFKILFNTLTLGASIPAQIQELFLGFESLSEISDYWEFSDDWSDNTVPSRSAFRLKAPYTTSVPTLYFRAHDLSDALLINNNTVTHSANFEYSTDNGTSWLPLGTIPNVVGTLIRYTFTSPPGVDIRPSIREA
jgi:hypothetical protein